MTGKTLKVVVFGLVIGAVLALSACSASGANDLEGTNWKLDSIGGVAAAHTATLSFADGKITGNAGCNSFGGGYKVDGSKITISEPIASTLMACENDVMDLETKYLTVLQSEPTFAKSGNQLTLTTPDGMTLVFSAAQP